ncbi:MAG: peptidylprolyl isomerase [Burkholderiales bacterium]
MIKGLKESKMKLHVAALAALLLGAVAAHAQTVEMKTSLGVIAIELNAEKAPRTVENFLRYVNDKHYDGTIFHRVIDGFMIQGGGFETGMKQKPTRAPIPLESRNGLKNDAGTIAMARTNVPDSATAQFFINVADNAMLNAPQPDGHGYAVFGRVVRGIDVVAKIKGVATGNAQGHQNVPTTPVVIEAVRVVDATKK